MSEVTRPEHPEFETRNRKARYLITGQRVSTLASILVPAFAVLVLILVLLRLQASTENATANLASLLPIGFAFAAGIVASVNPCGFLLLPAYISFQLGSDETGYYERSPTRRLLKALLLGAIATTGFVVVFALVGGVVAAGGQWLIRVFPYAGVLIGGVMVALGVTLLLTQADLGILAAGRLTVRRRRSARNVFLFGIVYAIGSLSCTLPIFLVVVGGSLATQDVLGSLGQFVSYALGMGAVLVAVTVGSSMFRPTFARGLRGAVPYVHRVSAMFLIGAGAYLVYYWVFFADAIF